MLESQVLQSKAAKVLLGYPPKGSWTQELKSLDNIVKAFYSQFTNKFILHGKRQETSEEKRKYEWKLRRKKLVGSVLERTVSVQGV